MSACVGNQEVNVCAGSTATTSCEYSKRNCVSSLSDFFPFPSSLLNPPLYPNSSFNPPLSPPLPPSTPTLGAMTTSPPPTLPIFTDSDVTALFNPSPSPSPPYSQSPSLLAPICIPQLNPTFDSPFIRAYAPALGEKGISKEEWLGFLDGLNLALVCLLLFLSFAWTARERAKWFLVGE